MALSNLKVILGIGVAVWTATNAVLNGAKIINERRDVVLTGKIKGEVLTREHKQAILYNDWLPTSVGVWSLSLGGIMAVIILPWLVMERQWYSIALSLIGCFAFLTVGVWNAVGGIAEFRLMKRSLER
jgi:hypothetical protein